MSGEKDFGIGDAFVVGLFIGVIGMFVTGFVVDIHDSTVAATFNNQAAYHAEKTLSDDGHTVVRLVRSPCGVDDSSLETLVNGVLQSRSKPGYFHDLWLTSVPLNGAGGSQNASPEAK